jgi:hypothetical protein
LTDLLLRKQFSSPFTSFVAVVQKYKDLNGILGWLETKGKNDATQNKRVMMGDTEADSSHSGQTETNDEIAQMLRMERRTDWIYHFLKLWEMLR